MKIDRLIGIITILLQKQKTTAPELAERFEVSRRTISRDIDDLCKAGIPITTTQGVHGGIAIMDGYKIEKTLFTVEELRAVFAGLGSLNSVTNGKKYENIMEKFAASSESLLLKNNLLIDLSSHYKETLAPKITLLQKNMDEHNKVTFSYYNKNGERIVTVDPYLVVFQWSSWYLFGFDNARHEFRMYKLNRMCDLRVTEDVFALQEIPTEKLEFHRYFTDEIQAEILFDPSVRYQLIEEYGRDCFTEQGGRLCFSFAFTNADYLISWVLSFGEKAELIKPVELRATLREQLRKMTQYY